MTTICNKPTGLNRLDKANGINVAAAYCFAFRNTGDYFDLVNEVVRLPVGPSKTVVPSVMGMAMSGDGTINTTYDLAFGYYPLVTSDGVGTGDFSLCVIANPISETNRRFQTGTYTSGGAFNMGALIANSNTTLNGATAGTMVFGTYATTALVASHAGSVDGATHIWHAVRRGNVHTLFRDGYQVATTTGTALDIMASNTRLGVGQYPDGGGTGYVNHHIALAMGWNRALSHQEVLKHAKNPWNIFKKVHVAYKGSGAVVSIVPILDGHRRRRAA